MTKNIREVGNMKSITKSQFYQLLGLVTAARIQANKLGLLEEAAAEILQIGSLSGNDTYSRGGYFVSDAAYDETDIEKGIKDKLKNEGIDIKE